MNLIDILEICANIIIYFKYMEEFVEKDEVNNILYEIYNYYLDLYIEQKQKNIILNNNLYPFKKIVVIFIKRIIARIQ